MNGISLCVVGYLLKAVFTCMKKDKEAFEEDLQSTSVHHDIAQDVLFHIMLFAVNI